MKKVIDQKTYNTQASKLLASHDEHLPRHDEQYLVEHLYLTDQNDLFLYGIGGPCTDYAKAYQRSFIGGYAITPLTVDAAKAWGQKNLPADEYLALLDVLVKL